MWYAYQGRSLGVRQRWCERIEGSRSMAAISFPRSCRNKPPTSWAALRRGIERRGCGAPRGDCMRVRTRTARPSS